MPNRERAFVPRKKLHEYLLSETHAVGRNKAAFFKRHGYNTFNADRLERNLPFIAENEPVIERKVSAHGVKIHVRTIWIIEPKDDRPRFVTAYPATKIR